ncbi:predicted protein [Brucella abortus bv. 4 str. 292]|uniref:Uncharacterized protein n=7 Tax=Brucella TaxID=234 RepID=A0AAI8E495_BRUSS|nr:hypothetical protein BS1330_I0247 [Brucella suis 1330]AEU05276.1 hypothetical protein BSVBI22_A0247 [Brucella suis VBI22]AHN45904.1 hypothetical protein BSS2_I0239 [Brucella suis bv. 1 str. S2]ASU72774.1 hypothetical protein CJP69_09685 [Brucella abortus]ATN21377.1 hypothetical protein CRN66_10510 [Brucella canis]ATQ51381.1 hypothetical protein CS875_01255 [Brucella suis]EEX56583.1 predicted protein [Brucella abortus bv. 4 str. 292]EEX58299.1 predicted protein [Brucella abortus bv. 2 str.
MTHLHDFARQTSPCSTDCIRRLIIIRCMNCGRRKQCGGQNYMSHGTPKSLGITGRAQGTGQGADMAEAGFSRIGCGEGCTKLWRPHHRPNFGRCRKVWLTAPDKFLATVIAGISGIMKENEIVVGVAHWATPL